jgi:hypothetical protein
MSQKYTTLVLLLCLNFYNPSTFAAQHALVVGINEYPHSTNLNGAVNDAELIRDALRRIHVQLPDERVLLNARATRANVIQAWRDMVKQAKRGDTLIFTYAGHGGQEADIAPTDETDTKDETLVLYDQYITDDELTDLFIKAKGYKILFVADSCHSGGLTRTVENKTCRSRFAGRDSYRSSIPDFNITTLGDEKERPAHVTFISAADSDIVSVCEYDFEDNGKTKAHGALSWFFAKALAGYADGNHNKRLERSELRDYLKTHIGIRTEQLYKPKVRPDRNNSEVVVVLSKESIKPVPPTHPNLRDVAIKVENGVAPKGLRHQRLVEKGYDLRFVINNRGITEENTEVYNKVDDQITTISSRTTAQWQRLIDKEQLLQVLSTQFDMRLKPVQIDLREGNSLHKRGEELNFSIKPTDAWQGLNALTLFNLAGDGELQFLYPLTRRNHSLTLQQFPYILKPLKVVPPFGGDHLVAILCMQPATVLHKLLANSSPYLPHLAQVISALHKQRCQVGQYAFFTKK